MKIPSKVYDVLKWVLIIVVPAAIDCFSIIAEAWGWDIPVAAIVITVTSIQTFLGICVGISTRNYKKGGDF